MIHWLVPHMKLFAQSVQTDTASQNWSLRWKYACLANMAILSFLGNFTALSIAPLTPIFIDQFNVTLSDVALLVR